MAGHEACEAATTNPPEACLGDCTIDPAYECELLTGDELDCVAFDAACDNDGELEPGERCDDGNSDSGDGCTPYCELEPECSGMLTTAGCTSTCGDGMILATDTNEECDDGNTVNGDGCSATCEIEDGWYCTISGSGLPDTIDIPITFRDFIAYPAANTNPT